MSFKQIIHISQDKAFTYDQERADLLQQEIKQENHNKTIFALATRKNKYSDTAIEIADELRQDYQNLVIFGMGGSSLGGKTLCGFKFFNSYEGSKQKKVFFVDNIHYHNLSIFLKNIDFSNTAFLIISKSGNTIETLCQTLVLLEYYKEELKQNKAKNLYFITEDSDNPLNKVAQNYNRKIIIHDNDVGGRYSCFTPVSLIPAHFCGIDIKKYLAGGIDILDDFIHASGEQVKVGANYLNYCYEKELKTQVFMPYLHRLYHLTYWYNQLLAESIGKNQHGITPLKALGSIDQHSVLQLFLDGPKDKFFTFLTSNSKDLGDKLIIPNYLKNDLDYFINNKLGDVIHANQEATIATIQSKDNILRKFHFADFDEYSLGQIMMHFMLETIFFAKILNINPFDQPQVEEGKARAREIMRNK